MTAAGLLLALLGGVSRLIGIGTIRVTTSTLNSFVFKGILMPNAYAVLHVQFPGGQEDAWPVTQPTMTLGRSSNCQVVLEDGSISRQHAEVTLDTWRRAGARPGIGQRHLAERPAAVAAPGPSVTAGRRRCAIGPFSLRSWRRRRRRCRRPLASTCGPAAGNRSPACWCSSMGRCSSSRSRRQGHARPWAGPATTTWSSRPPSSQGTMPGWSARPTGWFRIVDLGSTNGLLAGGRRVQQQTLRDGDAVSVLDQVWIQYRQSIGLAAGRAADAGA